VARKALAVGRETFDDYVHPNSPKKFTQPQLFACLAVRQTLDLGYEAMRVRLDEWSDLRATLGLDHTPGSSTLHDAERRLLKKGMPTGCWTPRSATPGGPG
jgi:hypothetical protein